VKKLTPYKLDVPRKERWEETPLNRVEVVDAAEEPLTGFIGDWEASDIEERFARSLIKQGIAFSFREHFFGPTRTTPGAVEIDFLTMPVGEVRPIQIDGEFAHKTQRQKDDDRIKDALFDEFGRKYGFAPVKRIPGELLQTQDDSDALVREMY